MSTIPFRTLLFAVVIAAALCAATNVRAQQKYTVSRAPSSSSQYVEQHAIDVDDVPGHQIRVYKLRYDYPKKDMAFAGVTVKETMTHGITDYVDFSGPFTTYSVYTLEDGNKVFSRSTGTSQAATRPDGTKVVRYIFVENFVGGTGKFKGMRGQMRGSGERALVAKSVTQDTAGEYWIEE